MFLVAHKFIKIKLIGVYQFNKWKEEAWSLNLYINLLREQYLPLQKKNMNDIDEPTPNKHAATNTIVGGPRNSYLKLF